MSTPYQSSNSESEEVGVRQPEVAGGHESDLSSAISDDAQHAQEHLQEKMGDAADAMSDKARSFAEQQKQDGAERVDDAATAVHRAADEIAKQSPVAGRYMHAGAEQLERASRLLRESSIDELYRMTNRLAHDKPLAFIGGSVAAGFLLARVLRSSNSAHPSRDGGRPS